MLRVVSMVLEVFAEAQIIDHYVILDTIIQIILNVVTIVAIILVIIDVFPKLKDKELPETDNHILVLILQFHYQFIKVVCPFFFPVCYPQSRYQVLYYYIIYLVKILLRLLPIKTHFDVFVEARCLTKAGQEFSLIDINATKCDIICHYDFPKKVVVNIAHRVRLLVACWSLVAGRLLVAGRWSLAGRWSFAGRSLVSLVSLAICYWSLIKKKIYVNQF